MKHRYSVPFVATFVLVVGLLFSCASGVTDDPDPRIVEAYTSGEISRHSTVRIVFARPVGRQAGQPTVDATVRLFPSVAGQTRWVDAWTLEFMPERPLEEGREYRVRYEPAAALAVKTGPFDFSFLVVPQEMELLPHGLYIVNPSAPDRMEFRASLRFSDVVTLEEARAAVAVRHDRATVEHVLDGPARGRSFLLRVPAITRRDAESTLRLSWSASAGRGGREQYQVSIPAVDSFEVLSVRPVNEQEQYVEVTFSQPVDRNQNLSGLFSAEKMALDISARSNAVRLYAAGGWPEVASLVIASTVRSMIGQALAHSVTNQVAFPSELPEVRFVGDGVIVPTSQGTTVPIETMNLNAVMVEAVQIYGTNVHQFLQVNQLDGDRELYRVGEVVWRKIIELDWDETHTDRWVRYGLDISPLLESDPTGLFQLRLTFRRPHIQYPCSDASEATADFGAPVTGPAATQESYWDLVSPDWQYRRFRTDPCHPAYYMPWYDHDITTTRNVMVSDIGLLAKQGQSGQMMIAASDLRTTEPLANVELDVFTFQKRSIASTRTNGEGLADLPMERDVPFFVLARHGGQFGYLRVDETSALNTSQFDTGGASIAGGIQGLIYGERGVWRPGDDIHLTFILNDPDDVLPEDHPVRWEIYDPRGQLVSFRTDTHSVGGMYSYSTRTAAEAITGTWTARVAVGDRSFTRPLRIESVIPNRLRIDLGFTGDPDYLESGRVTGDLAASWLYGAPAPGLDADIRVSFSPMETTFNGYQAYTFTDPAREFRAEEQIIFDATLDEQGTARIFSNLTVRDAPGMLRANLTTRVFEPSGAFSTEYASIPFSPFDRYVGIRTPRGDATRGMLLTDTEHTVDIVLVDEKGEPVPSGRVEAEIFKVNWRWWWENDTENLAAYVSRNNLQPIESDTVPVRDGRGQWTFQINYPDWGRYLIRVTDENGGHSTGTILYIDWPGWAGRALDEGASGATMLVLQPEQQRYNVGQEVNVQLPVSSVGRGLVTVEARGEVLEARWIEGQGESTTFSFTATPEMAPNVYVHVTYLQPHLQTANDLPIRTYGVVPVDVQDPQTHLEPRLDTAERYGPGEEVTVRVSEEGGRAMSYTVAIVDEGLLGLTRYRAPDPWDHFYQRLASGLMSWDLYNFVSSAYTGRLDTLLAVGGGDSGEDDGQRDRNRFEPVVIYLPPSYLAAGATNTHRVTIPHYFGAVRVMVVAASEDGAFGRVEKEVPVSQDVMVLGTLPRVLGINEQLEAPVTVFALDPAARLVSLAVETEGPVEAVGDTRDFLRFPETGEQTYRFSLRTTGEPGVAVVRFIAVGAGVRAVDETVIDVHVPGEPITSVTPVSLPAGGRGSVDLTLPGIAGTNTVMLELSQIPPLDLERRLPWLIRYPYGCIEQTTSAAFPQLYLDRLVDLNNADRRDVQANVVAAIDRIRRFQTPSGGISYWQGETKVHQWATNYAGHFLLAADARGYEVPEELITQWTAYQSAAANSWYSAQTSEMLTQAYRLYTLALARRPSYAAMNRLREMDGLPNVARWRLAAAYAIAGNQSTAVSLVRRAGITASVYNEPGETLGDEVRDLAMILEALVELDDSRAQEVAGRISEALTADAPLSTQSAAYALLAMARYAQLTGEDAELSFTWSWNGSRSEAVRSATPVVQLELPVGPQETAGSLELENQTQRRLFPRLIATGLPQPGTERRESNNLRLSVNYRVDDRAANPRELVVGDDVEIQVRVTNLSRSRRYENLALRHLLPPGWEIANDRLAGALNSAEFDYQDIRDDRIYTFFTLEAGESKTFTVRATAAYAGSYYLPMIVAEAMYEPEVNAVEPGFTVEVRAR